MELNNTTEVSGGKMKRVTESMLREEVRHVIGLLDQRDKTRQPFSQCNVRTWIDLQMNLKKLDRLLDLAIDEGIADY
jgi:hypothetical protein